MADEKASFLQNRGRRFSAYEKLNKLLTGEY